MFNRLKGMKMLNLMAILLACLASCRIPAKYKQSSGPADTDCGFFTFATIKNEAVNYQFPDIQMLLDNADSLELSSKQIAALEELNKSCSSKCAHNKQNILDKEAQLHGLLLSKKEQKDNSILGQVSTIVNKLEKSKVVAVNSHRTFYLKALGLLNKKQLKKTEKLKIGRDGFSKILGNPNP